jgi:hypothetical protein
VGQELCAKADAKNETARLHKLANARALFCEPRVLFGLVHAHRSAHHQKSFRIMQAGHTVFKADLIHVELDATGGSQLGQLAGAFMRNVLEADPTSRHDAELESRKTINVSRIPTI